ncbi:hypothetical protein, partial [Candidatus Allofournierella excrementavium]
TTSCNHVCILSIQLGKVNRKSQVFTKKLKKGHFVRFESAGQTGRKPSAGAGLQSFLRGRQGLAPLRRKAYNEEKICATDRAAQGRDRSCAIPWAGW